MRSALLFVPFVAAAAGIAGCGASSTGSGGGNTAAPITPKATHTRAVAAPPVVTATTTAVQPPATSTAPKTSTTSTTSAIPSSTYNPCRIADLKMSLGSPEGTAGSSILPIHFTNNSVGTCTISGYPGVSYVAPNTGKQVGEAAERSSGKATTDLQQPGEEATALAQAPDIDAGASDCQATAASGLRIYPPNSTAAAYVPFTQAENVCSTGAGRLQVMPVTAGSGS